MSSINSNEIISILKEEIENFDMMSKDSEVGTVITVGDGIASIYGIDHAMYGEIVTFENGLKGMVQDIRRNEIGCILFGSDTRISGRNESNPYGKESRSSGWRRLYRKSRKCAWRADRRKRKYRSRRLSSD